MINALRDLGYNTTYLSYMRARRQLISVGRNNVRLYFHEKGKGSQTKDKRS